MCRPHWARVPRDVQQAVYGAYNTYQRVSRRDPADAVTALAELRAVQADAIAFAGRARSDG